MPGHRAGNSRCPTAAASCWTTPPCIPWAGPTGPSSLPEETGIAGGAAAVPLLRGGGGEALLREDQQEDERPLELELLELARVAETREAAAAAPMEA